MNNRPPYQFVRFYGLHLLALPFLLLLVSSPVVGQRQLAREPQANNSERRIALVIGNATYANAPPLKNPANDARDMSATLKSLGFDVVSGTNLNQREMKRLIRELGQKLRGGGSGLFYYSGHGIQSKGRNYLIPVDADIQGEADVEDSCVDLNLVLNYMDEAQNGLNIVILDACRTNPFGKGFRSATYGLAQVEAPTGTLIAYATAPGRVAMDGNGQNGVYTSELLRHMRVPGLSVIDVFMRVRSEVMRQTANQQVPWEASSLVGTFCFSCTTNAAAITSTPTTPAKTPNNPLDAFDPEQYYARALAYVNKGDLDNAMIDIQKAIDFSPAMAQAYVVRAGIHHFRRNLDAAIADATKAIELNMKHEGPYLVRGASYNVKGQYDLALIDFNKALEFNPQSGYGYSGLGVSYNGKGDPDRAILEFTKALALLPSDAQTYYNRGNCYFLKKDYDHALADFSKAIEISPNLAVAYNYRALIYDKKGEIAKAEADR